MSKTERPENAPDDRQEIKPDLCVIGAGPGGLAAASAAAAFGVNVVLIERGPADGAIDGAMGGAMGSAMGGTMTREQWASALACQAFVAAAARALGSRQGLFRGDGAGMGSAVDFALLRAHLRTVVAAAAPERSRERINGLGVRVVEGEGRFTDARTVAVNRYDVRARRFVIATGSTPARPDIPGLAEVPYLTTETIFDLDACPRHLIVIGADSIGLALAQAFRRFGAAVTVLENATPLADADAECAAIVLDALAREGVAVRGGIAVKRLRRQPTGIDVDIGGDGGDETIEGSHVLLAAGRRPAIEALNLDAAGIRYSASGITVDSGLRTSNRQVYAIGDVAAMRCSAPRSTAAVTPLLSSPRPIRNWPRLD
jgi:pyruvate/2-oxoglutarate dehydrogenase complex dihydrolipoamide dehydrogenase (E3) component